MKGKDTQKHKYQDFITKAQKKKKNSFLLKILPQCYKCQYNMGFKVK